MRARQSVLLWTAAVMILGLFIAPLGNTTDLGSVSQSAFYHSLRQWYGEHHEDQWQANPLTIQQVNGTGVITGTVTGGGTSIKKAQVFCWSVVADGVVSQSAVTDDQGKYALENLNAGDYYIVAGAEGFAALFYRNAKTPLDAELVKVAEGQTVSGIDFNLRKLPQGTGAVSGRVTDEKSGAPIAGAWVIVSGRKNPFVQANQFAVSDASGYYKISNLTNDIYVAAAYANHYLPEFYNNAYTITAAAPIVVATTEVTGIDFPLAKGGSMAGMVKTSDGEPMAGVKIHVEAVDRNGIGMPGLDILRQMTYSDGEGKYQVTGLPAGKYYVSAATTVGGFWMVKYFDDKLERKDADPVTVLEGTETAGINFQFTPPTGKITGKVVDLQGKPLAGVFITFIYKGDYFENWGRLWHHAVTDENGAYELTNLRPGTYFVGAWVQADNRFKGLWYNNVEKFEDATAVVLAEGQTVTGIDFVLDTADDFGSISGAVTYEITDAPVVNALIQAIPKNAHQWGDAAGRLSVLLTFTDANGKYKLQPVFKGDYYVVVRHNGYVEFFDDKTAETADAVTVKPGEETANINFKIPQTPAEGSIVSGIVTDEKTGAPISKAMVTFFPAKRPRWFVGPAAKWTRVYYSTFTDSDGKYTIGGIPEGDYFASAWARGYIGELFDDTHNLRKAVVIQLSGNDEIKDINFALKPAYHKREPFGGVIAGMVQSGDGGVDQALIFAMDDHGEPVASAVTAPDGSYALTDLESGDYRVMVLRPSFEPRFYPNAADIDSAQPVSVNSADPAGVSNVNVILSAEITTTAGDHRAPQEYALEQNYPNPFNPSTMIEYRVPAQAMVTLQVFNVQGRLVNTLVSAVQNSGAHQAVWNGLDQNGAPVPSGIYFYQLQTDDFTEIKSMMLLK